MFYRTWPLYPYCLILVCCILLAGCSAKLPQTTPVEGKEREYLLDRYQVLHNRACAKSIDADVSFVLKTFGKHQKAAGFLQVLPPSSLRVTIFDQIDRPIVIFVSTGETFTLVDSMNGQGIVGSVESITKHEGASLYLQPDEVITLLQGRLTPETSCLLEVRKDKNNSELAWLIFSPNEKNRHNVLFDAEAERIHRYVIGNSMGKILLDIKYTWRDVIEGDCILPDELKVTGAVLKGDVTLKYDHVIVDAVIPESIFKLTLPEHYNIKVIE